MSTTDTAVNQLIINRLTKTQFEGVSPSSNELWAVDPEFAGSKILATDNNGEIVESSDVPTSIQALSATDSITLTDGVLYQGGEQTSLTIALPASASVGFISQVTFQSGSTPTSITSPVSGLFLFIGVVAHTLRPMPSEAAKTSQSMCSLL